MATITYIISDTKLAAFKIGFLKKCPVPVNADENPMFTVNEWIKEWGKRQFLEKYKCGMKQIASEAVVIETEIIT